MVLVISLLCGILLGMACLGCGIAYGVKLVTRTGQHFVDTYVKKLSLEDEEKIYNRPSEESVSEETLNALAMDEREYRRMMEWTTHKGPEDNEEGDY